MTDRRNHPLGVAYQVRKGRGLLQEADPITASLGGVCAWGLRDGGVEPGRYLRMLGVIKLRRELAPRDLQASNSGLGILRDKLAELICNTAGSVSLRFANCKREFEKLVLKEGQDGG